MKLFGRVISIVAACTLRDTWKRLEQELRSVYAAYWVSTKYSIMPLLVATLIEAEDHRFYQHGGVDLIAIGRAIWRFAVQGVWHGGSTIEQQLVRSVSGRYERSLKRKAREIMFASLVYKAIPKVDVPGVYLTVAYFGWGMNGIVQAYRRLGIKPQEMTLHRAASVVARLKYPEPRVPSPERERQIRLRIKHIEKLVQKRYGRIKLAEGGAIPEWFVPS